MDRIIGFDKQLLIQMAFQFFNTIICVLILYYLLYKPVKKFMANRSKKIENNIQDAQKKLLEAENLKNKYELNLKEIQKKQDQMLEAAHAQAIKTREEIINNAKQDAIKIRSQANFEANQIKKQIYADSQQNLINISCALTSKILKENFTPDSQEKFINYAINELKNLKKC